MSAPDDPNATKSLAPVNAAWEKWEKWEQTEWTEMNPLDGRRMSDRAAVTFDL